MDIAIAVEPLGIGRVLDEGIGGEEPPQDRVVFPGVHVDEPNLVVHLVTGEASCDGSTDGARCVGTVCVSALAVGVVTQAADDVAGLVGDGVHGQEMVGVDIPGLGGAVRFLGVDADQGVGGIEVVLVVGGP